MLNCHKIIYDESEGYKIFIFFFYSCEMVKLNKVSSTPIFCVSYFPSYCLIMMGKRQTGSIPLIVLSRISYCYVPRTLSQICT